LGALVAAGRSSPPGPRVVVVAAFVGRHSSAISCNRLCRALQWLTPRVAAQTRSDTFLPGCRSPRRPRSDRRRSWAAAPR